MPHHRIVMALAYVCIDLSYRDPVMIVKDLSQYGLKTVMLGQDRPQKRHHFVFSANDTLVKVAFSQQANGTCGGHGVAPTQHLSCRFTVRIRKGREDRKGHISGMEQLVLRDVK